MRKIKKSTLIIFFMIVSLTFLFCPPAPVAHSSTPATINPVNQENRDNTLLNKNKFINDKLEDIKINKDRNEIGKFKNSNNEKSYLKNFSNKLEDLQIKINNIKKNIKIIDENEKYQIKDDYLNIKFIIDKLDNDNNSFLNKIQPDEKILIKEQNNIIIKSITNLRKFLINIDKDFDKIKSNEELYNKTVEIEKEIKNINRQYRAIEWILFEQ